MAPRSFPGVALGLVGMAVAQAVSAAPLVDQTGRSRATLAAEWLQDCLDTDARFVGGEDAIDVDGKWARKATSIPVSTRSPATLAKKMSSCATPARACALPGSLRRPLAIDVVEGEAHPAWSTNDRARIVDLVPGLLRNLGESNPRVTVASATQGAANGLHLDVRIEFAGSGVSHRAVDEWVVAARALRVHLTLSDQATKTKIAARDIDVGLPWGLRARRAETSSASWMTRTLGVVETGAREMLDELQCEPDVLAASRNPSGRWQLSLDGREGLEAGRTVLMVPANDATIATRWPIARVVSVNGNRSAELEFVRGDETACTAEGCSALVL